jgi:hypothetical protein
VRGRTFKTNVFIKGVTQNQTMQRAARFILDDGWQINSTDNKPGIINATVSYGQGKTRPLNVGIEPGARGRKSPPYLRHFRRADNARGRRAKLFLHTVHAVEGK